MDFIKEINIIEALTGASIFIIGPIHTNLIALYIILFFRAICKVKDKRRSIIKEISTLFRYTSMIIAANLFDAVFGLPSMLRTFSIWLIGVENLAKAINIGVTKSKSKFSYEVAKGVYYKLYDFNKTLGRIFKTMLDKEIVERIERSDRDVD